MFPCSWETSAWKHTKNIIFIEGIMMTHQEHYIYWRCIMMTHQEHYIYWRCIMITHRRTLYLLKVHYDNTSRNAWCFRPLLCTLFRLNWAKVTPGILRWTLMTKLAPEWVRTSYPVIRSPARYRWTAAPAWWHIESIIFIEGALW